MITVNTNMASIIAQNSLYKSTNKMNTALQRLSTGLRINSAKDDAAGSAVSTKLEYKISSYDVAKDNAQMGQSMLDTANSTLSKVNSMLQRIRDLSEQASNGTYGDDERKAMQSEIDALTEEIYRIKNTTEFNGKKILGEEEKPSMTSIPTMSINDINLENLTQAEWDNNYKGQVFGISNAKELQKLATIVNDKKINTTDTTFALTADIDLDELGDIDGNGSNWTAIGKNSSSTQFKSTFDGNGYTIYNLKINKSNEKFQGLFGYNTENITIKNVNLSYCNILGKSYIGGLLGYGNSNIENCSVSGNIEGNDVLGGLCGEFNNNCYMTDCSFIGTVNGNNIIGGLVGNIFNLNGVIKNCYSSADLLGKSQNGKFIGSINTNSTNTEFINCYYDESKSTSLNVIGKNNSGKDFSDIKATNKNPFEKEISINTNLQVGIDSGSNSVITIDTGVSLDNLHLNVKSESLARLSLDTLDNLMSRLTDKMTDIGSTQNQLISTMEFQEVQRQALTSANSLIKDADIALESANYIKNQILQSVTSSILATANQNPQIALQLI